MEGLDEQKKAEHECERGVKLIPEDCERQKRFCDEEPQSIIKPLEAESVAEDAITLQRRASTSFARSVPKKTRWTT